jgi:hypothetical protein
VPFLKQRDNQKAFSGPFWVGFFKKNLHFAQNVYKHLFNCKTLIINGDLICLSRKPFRTKKGGYDRHLSPR